MRKNKGHKQIIQDHYDLCNRIGGMIAALKKTPVDKRTDAQKAAIISLEEQADEHYRKMQIFNRVSFIMVMR